MPSLLKRRLVHLDSRLPVLAILPFTFVDGWEHYLAYAWTWLDPGLWAALVEERQYLYQEFTLQMHGKNRKMLKGYRADNTRVSGNASLSAAAFEVRTKSCE